MDWTRHPCERRGAGRGSPVPSSQPGVLGTRERWPSNRMRPRAASIGHDRSRDCRGRSRTAALESYKSQVTASTLLNNTVDLIVDRADAPFLKWADQIGPIVKWRVGQPGTPQACNSRTDCPSLRGAVHMDASGGSAMWCWCSTGLLARESYQDRLFTWLEFTPGMPSMIAYSHRNRT
jgi:hypothetical protein